MKTEGGGERENVVARRNNANALRLGGGVQCFQELKASQWGWRADNKREVILDKVDNVRRALEAG